MSVIFSSEEHTAMDRSSVPIVEFDVVSLGDEFDLADDDCQTMLASELPLNSELSGMPFASHR